MNRRKLLKTVDKGRDAIRMWRGAPMVRKTGFWFVDIPRTSSSSIKAELGMRYGPAYGKTNLIERQHATEQLFKDHLTAATMRDTLGTRTWKQLYTFTFVRNPFDRVVSLYSYRRKKEGIPADWTFSEFVQRLVKADQKTARFKGFAMRSTMSDYILDRDGTVLVDDIFRFEEREAGIRKIADRIGYPELGQLHVQRATPPGQSYQKMYDDPTRELVERYFWKDLELFDYSF